MRVWNVKLSDHFNGNISIAGPQSSLIFYGAYNKTDTTTGALQFVDGMTLFYCSGLQQQMYLFKNTTFYWIQLRSPIKSDPNEDVMIPKQSTTALPDRLTQG